MTSKDLHRQIAAFVADRINEDEYRTRTLAAKRECDDCGATLTRDLMARMALARSGREQQAEMATSRAMLNGTTSDGAPKDRPAPLPPAPPKGVERILSDIVSPVGIVAAIAIALIGLSFVFRSSDGEESRLDVRAADESAPVDVKLEQPQNLFNEAMRNFELIARGELGVQVPGERRRDVEEYFASNGITYPVVFPIVKLPLAGGIVSRYVGRAFAQLVYASDNEAVYVMQTPVDEVRSGKRLYITPDVLARLEKGEKIREMTPEGASLIMLRQGDLVITAVGNMEPDVLESIVRGS